MFELKKYLSSRQELINEKSLFYLKNSNADYQPVIQAMMYSLLAGGKRVRPILCMAACEAVGGNIEDVISTACALEMIHTYSLIHDDLPAMDNDDLRRGNPTCHIKFDESTAILAGDALLNHAFYIMSDTPLISPEKALLQLRVIRLISEKAGFHGMISGQILDIASEGKTLSRTELETIHKLKTGALIEASVCSGGILGTT